MTETVDPWAGWRAEQLDRDAEAAAPPTRAKAAPPLPQRPKAFDGAMFGRRMAELVRGYVERETAALRKRTEALEAAAARKTGELRYLGAWRDRIDAKRGDMVTFQGQLWYCLQDTDQPPGTADWQLMQKRGK